jgi:hypothetical protein
MQIPKITWFGNNHEHRLHYVKFGLMRLAKLGEISFKEIHKELAEHPAASGEPAHKAMLRVEDGTRVRSVVLDGQDSIFQLSPLIEHVDLYFMCSYRAKFFHGEGFDLELPWQTALETRHYRDHYSKLQHRYSRHFHKTRRLMPIGPYMEWTRPPSYLERKVRGLRHKLSKFATPFTDWGIQFARFEKRWDWLLKLRSVEPRHDVVLKDSLWGWPRHRVALHRELARLSPEYDIRAELHHRVAEPYELGEQPAPRPDQFPMLVGGGVPGNYEEILASSRLGVFATGFHYGCRNITTLAWFLGLPTLCDPFSFESIYDFGNLGNTVHQSGDWREIEAALAAARGDTADAKRERQAAYDRIASPDRAARWIVEESLK